MIKLRPLKNEDADRMISWMHDEYVTCNMNKDFGAMTLDDCISFIEKSRIDNNNIHMAVTDENDHYLGTVSLKEITNKRAEFAIVMCRDTFGKGISISAMELMLEVGFTRCGLDIIYWYVSKDNDRALMFYDKNGFNRVSEANVQGYNFDTRFIWYQLSYSDFWGRKRCHLV